MAEDEKVGDIFIPNKHNISTVIKKISELEEKLEDHIDWSINEERIEKLEQQVKGWNAMYEIQKTELNELKEQIENLKLSVVDNNQWIIDNDSIKEVLREVMNRLDLDFEDLLDKLEGDSRLPNNDAIQDQEEFIQTLKGGDSKRDREIKAMDRQVEKLIKGGEQSDEVHSGVMRVGEQVGDNKTSKDSNPPIARQTDIFETAKLFLEINGWDERFSVVAKEDLERWQTDYYCPRCGNEISDVENAVNSLYIEVEREDLERWKYNIKRFMENLLSHHSFVLSRVIKEIENYLGGEKP